MKISEDHMVPSLIFLNRQTKIILIEPIIEGHTKICKHKDIKWGKLRKKQKGLSHYVNQLTRCRRHGIYIHGPSSAQWWSTWALLLSIFKMTPFLSLHMDSLLCLPLFFFHKPPSLVCLGEFMVPYLIKIVNIPSYKC